MKLAWVLLAAVSLHAAEEMPDWARQAGAQPVPSYPAKVYAAVLLHEENTAVDADGRRVMRERGVLKILQKSSDSITAYRSYNTKAGRIRDFRAWLQAPGGPVRTFSKDNVADIALSPEFTYDEGRAKLINPGSGLAPGSVFAYEVTEEIKTVFVQCGYDFQDNMPVLVSRFVLSVPAGWQVRGTLFNHAPMDPAVEGSTYTWELRDLPWIEDERYSPDMHALVPRLGVTFTPADNKGGMTPLSDWASVSAWLTGLVDPAAEPNDAIRSKATELTHGAASEIERIRAIAEFTQRVNYVSVQMNVTRGGGYTPHSAADILARNYGDCKDKATLMRSLLKAAGIDSYLTVIYASDRTYVREEWPSPEQFNHAIVAVRISPSTTLPIVLVDPRLGRLLMFDPTDPDTPLGDLPADEQGSHALIVAGPQGGLIAMPFMPASANRVESNIEGTLDNIGALQAHVGREYFGQAAARAHTRVAHQTNEQLKRGYEKSLARSVGAIAVKQAEITGRVAEGRMRLSLDFTAEHFSQVVQSLILVRPGALALDADYVFTTTERKLPVKLEGEVYKDSVRIQLPPGYKVDEIPDAVKFESPYGVYQASWKADGAGILFEQSTEVRDMLAPVAKYAEVKAFFDNIMGSQGAPVVLVRK